jgi:hypothetical protein
MSLLDEIKQRSKVDFRPATQMGIDALRSLGVPSDALAFYRESEPARTAEIGNVARSNHRYSQRKQRLRPRSLRPTLRICGLCDDRLRRCILLRYARRVGFNRANRLNCS